MEVAALRELQAVAGQELCWWSPDTVCDRSNWVITNHYLITTHNIDGLFGLGCDASVGVPPRFSICFPVLCLFARLFSVGVTYFFGMFCKCVFIFQLISFVFCLFVFIASLCLPFIFICMLGLF